MQGYFVYRLDAIGDVSSPAYRGTRVFAGLAQQDRVSTGWFFSFKLHWELSMTEGNSLT